MTNLLIIGCSQRKIESDEYLAAIDRYDGPAYRTLRKMRDNGTEPQNVDVFILSAKHGLIPCQKPIDDYDMCMTPKRADAMRLRVQNKLKSFMLTKRGGYDQVFINLGKNYMRVLEGFNWGTISTMEASGGIGQKTQQMKVWLERLAAAAMAQGGKR